VYLKDDYLVQAFLPALEQLYLSATTIDILSVLSICTITRHTTFLQSQILAVETVINKEANLNYTEIWKQAITYNHFQFSYI